MFAEFLNNVNGLLARCDMDVISRRLNSPHQATTSCCSASVVVSDTNSDLGVNCSDKRCTRVSPRWRTGVLKSTSARSAMNCSTSLNFCSICKSSTESTFASGKREGTCTLSNSPSFSGGFCCSSEESPTARSCSASNCPTWACVDWPAGGDWNPCWC